MKTIAFFNNIHSSALWHQLTGPLEKDGIRLLTYGFGGEKQLAEDIDSGRVDILLTNVAADMPGFADLKRVMLEVPVRVGLGSGLPSGFSTLPEAELEAVQSYFAVLSKENFHQGLRRLAGLGHEPCRKVSSSGIYHPDAPDRFDTVEAYHAWLVEERGAVTGEPVAGIIMHYSMLAEGNHADIDALVRELEQQDVVPFCVFCDTLAESSPDRLTMYPWYRYFREKELHPDVILNALMGRLIASAEDRMIFRELDVPVMQLIRNYTLSPEQWLEDPVGISAMSLTHSLVQPEMFGVIDPVMIAGSRRNPEDPYTVSTAVPIAERIRAVAGRVRRWVRLRRLSNSEKRVAIVLHNNPCKGVESTVGMAAGLDTFNSLIALLRRMQHEGYDVGTVPENGKALLDQIQERKALHEFRWTTTDEIVRKGGVLHTMGRKEYDQRFSGFDASVRAKVDDDWGAFPGEGMVWQQNGDDAVLITGLRFGNITVMAQPKRGCYGARCDGEVCRILHDPEISPSHQWLATYFWIQDHADAVLHFGTSGALEYLPGKRAVLSGNCFSDISLGDLPNIYPYIMDVPGEGMTAKRRGRAVIVDHLTPASRPADVSDELASFEEMLVEYRRAADGNERSRLESLGGSMLKLAVKLRFLDEGASVEQLHDGVERFSRQIERVKRSMVPDGMHLFGRVPDNRAVAAIILSAVPRSPVGVSSYAEIAAKHPAPGEDVFENAVDLVCALLDESAASDHMTSCIGELPPDLMRWCREMAGNVRRAGEEIESLLQALDGGYVDAGLAGSPSSGKPDVLPSGRNFFAADIMTMPTDAAWDIGRELGDRLLERFYREEGRFPESIGLSLWSSDAFKSDGETLAQIFHLLGVSPLRQPNGRVSNVRVIPAEELVIEIDGTRMDRPRVDATIETSSIVRDMVPHFITLIDKAVTAVSACEEPPEVNAVRKHTLEQFSRLQQDLSDRMDESSIQRLALFRVFSSTPGTYGSGVGLMLDASAWEQEADLGEAYINHTGYAYGGAQLDAGREAHELLARQLSRIDITCIKQTSAEYDALDCSCYASSAGGMTSAVSSLSGRKPKTWWIDATVPGEHDIRDFRDEIDRSTRAKLFNREWIRRMKEHGFQGAQSFAAQVNTLFKWSATTGEVEDRVFNGVVETFVADEENREWLREQNPYALEEITRRLLEAEARGLWDARQDLLDDVRTVALVLEGDLEERIGDVDEEFQGSRIDVLTEKDVDRWRSKWNMSGKAEGRS